MAHCCAVPRENEIFQHNFKVAAGPPWENARDDKVQVQRQQLCAQNIVRSNRPATTTCLSVIVLIFVVVFAVVIVLVSCTCPKPPPYL